MGLHHSAAKVQQFFGIYKHFDKKYTKKAT